MSDLGHLPTAGPARMRELDLGDRFWREALDALRGEGLEALVVPYPSYVETLGEIARQAREDAALVGLRFDGEDRNARLFGFLSAGLLARSGLRALFVDLSQDLRWLERLAGLDLKQGLVDHVHYGVPLERCVRDTAMPGLAVLTGGTRFMAGSPLEDAPAIRACLDRLKQHFQVVVLALPSSEPVSEAGVFALCDVLLAVLAEGEEIELLGRERLCVRLVGDPLAAEELARAAHRFVGPIPALLGASSPAREAGPRAGSGTVRARAPASGVPAAVRGAEEDVAFLSLFEEGSASEAKGRAGVLEGFEEIGFPDTERPVADPEWPARRRRRRVASVGLAAVVIGGMLLGMRLLPSLERRAGGDEGQQAPAPAIDRSPIGFEEGAEPESAAVVPLVEQAAPEGGAEEAGRAPGRPAPYSLHVGSFQSEESALETAIRLERAGWTAFVAPIELGDRGRWHRVYAGTFADSATAGEALRRLLGGGLVSDGAVRATPLTFLLGTYPTREEAEQRRVELRSRGIPAYVAGAGPARVYAGAYATREESRLLEGSLHAAAEEATLTARVES